MQLSRTYADETGVGWIASDPAYMQRASHAVVDGGGVWLIDPVDGPGLDDVIGPLGPVRGVLQLLDRHPRDCAALASRFGVPHHVAPREPVPGLSLRPLSLGSRPWWRETALWWEATRTLVVAESVGTAPYYLAPGAPLGVHPLRRLTPPRSLAGLDVARVLPSHGAPAAGPDTARALRDALDRSRRDIPAVAARLIRHRGRPPA